MNKVDFFDQRVFFAQNGEINAQSGPRKTVGKAGQNGARHQS